MTAILIAMIVVLTIAAGIAGVVVVGMQGRGSQHVPKLTDSMSRVARHLNGEAEPHRTVVRTH